MNSQLALLGIVEIISAISCGIFILFTTHKLIMVYGKKKLQITEVNQAYRILTAFVLFSVGYIMSGVIEPLVSMFKLQAYTQESSLQLIINFVIKGGIYIGISYLLAMIVILLGVATFTYITPMNEVKEIKNNNTGVALTIGVIILIMALLTKSGINILIESMIPYPAMPPR